MNTRKHSWLVSAGIVLLALAWASPATAAPESRAAREIRQVMAAQQAAWNRGDVVTFMRGYRDSPQTTFVGTQVRKGYRTILDSYRRHYTGRAQMGHLSFTGLEVRLLPSAHGPARYAIVTGYFHLERSARGTAKADDGVFSLVWEHTRRGWKIILDHSS